MPLLSLEKVTVNDVSGDFEPDASLAGMIEVNIVGDTHFLPPTGVAEGDLWALKIGNQGIDPTPVITMDAVYTSRKSDLGDQEIPDGGVVWGAMNPNGRQAWIGLFLCNEGQQVLLGWNLGAF